MSLTSRKQVFTTGEVARICHVAPRTVSKWFDTGKLRGYRIPGSRDRRIPLQHLLTFMRAHGIPMDELDEGTCRVLIFDRDVRDELIEAIQATGQYEVRKAENGFQAGVLAREFEPHVIVIDADDAEQASALCGSIRATPALQQAKIIAAAGKLSEQRRRQLLSRGFDGCIETPYTHEQLIDAIQEVTDLMASVR